MNNAFLSSHRVKFDLFRRYGYIATAGDRHLTEFCEGKWYLKDPETVKEWGFGLTSVQWRKDDLVTRLEKSEKLRTGEEKVRVIKSGEEGVNQLRAILGLCDLVTNVNIPNIGQIPNLPLGAVVETNAAFRAGSVVPVMAGEIPAEIYPLVSRICGDLDLIFNCFANDPLVTCSIKDAKKLFREMIENTKEYLTMYELD